MLYATYYSILSPYQEKESEAATQEMLMLS